LCLALLEDGREPAAEQLLEQALPVSVQAIEQALEQHQSEGCSSPFLLSAVQELRQRPKEPTASAKGNAVGQPSSTPSVTKELPASVALHGVCAAGCF